MRRIVTGSIALLTLVQLLFSSGVVAQETIGEEPPDRSTKEVLKEVLEDIWTRDKLTGDWWGGRTWLSKHGIDIDLRLSQYGQWVASGGVDRNGEYGGTMDYRLNIDGHKLGLWQGFFVNLHARTRFGQDVNADAGSFVFPNTGMLSPKPGDYHGTNVTGLTISQYVPVFGLLTQITVGKLDIIDTVTGIFPWVAYGQEGFWNINAMVSALPWFGAVRGLSLYGALGMTVNQEYKMPQSAFLVAGTDNVSTSWDISDSFDDGVWLAGFHRFFWKIDEKPGYFMVFAGGSTRDQVSNEPHDFVFIPGQGIVSTEKKKPWDIALYVYQEFWRAEDHPDRKAQVVIGGTGGPDNPQFAQWNIFANVEAFGPMKSRPHDRMGVAGWWNGLSPNFKDLVSPVIDLRDTWGFELYYNLAINKWLHLSPDLQLVQNPRKADNFAVIPGVRLVIDF